MAVRTLMRAIILIRRSAAGLRRFVHSRPTCLRVNPLARIPGIQVEQAVPFTEKLVGEVSLLLNVPVKPTVTAAEGAMEAS
jgi:hypothetical protein